MLLLRKFAVQKADLVAYERPGGILARIFDDKGNVIGWGFGVVWSPAVLAAETNADILSHNIAEALKREGINSEEDIRLVAERQGYGRVLTAAALALIAVSFTLRRDAQDPKSKICFAPVNT
jgi:hypothetical protein